MNNSPRSLFRVFAVIFFLLLFGVAMFAHGWVSWSEGSILIRPRHGVPYIATPNDATASSFYAYTIGFMVIGSLASLFAGWLIWLVSCSSPARKEWTINRLSQPLKERDSPPIPVWFFWGVISAVVSIFVYAALKST